MAFSEARRQEFSPGTPVFSPPSQVNGSANRIKLKKKKKKKKKKKRFEHCQT